MFLSIVLLQYFFVIAVGSGAKLVNLLELGVYLARAISRLGVNLDKSESIPVRRVENIKELARVWLQGWGHSLPLTWTFLWLVLLSLW